MFRAKMLFAETTRDGQAAWFHTSYPALTVKTILHDYFVEKRDLGKNIVKFFVYRINISVSYCLIKIIKCFHYLIANFMTRLSKIPRCLFNAT